MTLTPQFLDELRHRTLLSALIARPPSERFSTSLETNGGEVEVAANSPFASSEVEKPFRA